MSFEIMGRPRRATSDHSRAVLRSEAPAQPTDLRVEIDRRISQDREHLGALLRETLARAGKGDEAGNVENVVDSLLAIHEAWHRVKQGFLAAGRHLLRNEREVPFAYRRIVEHGSFLPFHESLASKLRQIARAVEAGRIEERLLPPTYSVAYELAILPDAALERAREEGLLGPKLRMVDVRQLKVRLAAPGEGQPEAQVRKRISDLRRRREALDAEIAELEHQLRAEPGRQRRIGP
jgi:hypothetical protein